GRAWWRGGNARHALRMARLSRCTPRLWKAFAISIARPRPGERILDVATGSADLAASLARRVMPGGEVWLTDINRRMLECGRDRVLDEGLLAPAVQCDAECLPFAAGYFD